MYEMIASEGTHYLWICGVIRADTKMTLGHEGGAYWSASPGADRTGRPRPTSRSAHAIVRLTLPGGRLGTSAGLPVVPGPNHSADTDANFLGDTRCCYIYPGEQGPRLTHRHSRALQSHEGSRTCLLSPITLLATGPTLKVTMTLQG
jgi:hypothetical protein